MSHQHRRLLIVATIAASAALAMPAHSQPLAMAEPDEPAPIYRQNFPERYAPSSYAPRSSRDQVVEPEAVTSEMPARLRRQIVDYPTREAPGTIVIDTPNTYLYYVLGGGRAVRYGIGVGREGFTWSGVQTVSRKQEWPDWHPPAEMIARQPYLPRFMSGGPGNPLGARAMYLGSSLYRIHGTNDPTTIGHRVSSGCIRLTNEDVQDLYSRVTLGTKVVVLPDSRRRAPANVARAPAPLRQTAQPSRYQEPVIYAPQASVPAYEQRYERVANPFFGAFGSRIY
jgi:lipoprotein-anchoring transpeptidase ErfK/SrfK